MPFELRVRDSMLVSQLTERTMLARSRISDGPPTNASSLSLAASSSKILEMGADPEVVHLSSSKRTLFVTSCVADVVPLSGPCPPAMRRSERSGSEPPGVYGII